MFRVQVTDFRPSQYVTRRQVLIYADQTHFSLSVVQFVDGMDYGIGFDTLKTRVRGFGLLVDSPTPTAIAGDSGQIVSFSLQRITTLEEYQQALDISVNVSASFGLVGGSAQFDFSQSHSFNSYSDYVIAKVIVDNPMLSIHGIHPSVPAATLVQNGNLQAFQNEFGNTFVEGIQSGGAYYALFEFVTQTDEQQQQVGAAIGFNYLSFTANADFSSKIDSMTQNTSLQISSLQIGGSGQGANPSVEIDVVIQNAEDFPNDVLNAGVPTKAFIQDYGTLDFPNPPNPVDIQNREDVLTQYYQLRNALLNKLNDIIYITQEHPEQFGNVDSYNLPVAQQKIQGWLDTITENASHCMNTIDDCQFQTPLMDIINLPPRKAADGSTQLFKYNVTLSIPPPPGPQPSNATTLAWLGLLGITKQLIIEDISYSVPILAPEITFTAGLLQPALHGIGGLGQGIGALGAGVDIVKGLIQDYITSNQTVTVTSVSVTLPDEDTPPSAD
jgi:hypothetical protein